MSTIKDIIIKEMSNIDDKMHNLNDKSIKGLHFFLKEVLKLENYSIYVDFDNIEIKIQPKTQDGEIIPTNEINKEDRDKMFSYLPVKLGIPKYKITFCGDDNG